MDPQNNSTWLKLIETYGSFNAAVNYLKRHVRNAKPNPQNIEHVKALLTILSLLEQITPSSTVDMVWIHYNKTKYYYWMSESDEEN